MTFVDPPLPGILVDPAGQTATVSITSQPSGTTPTVYVDPYAAVTKAMPATISTATTFFLPAAGRYAVTLANSAGTSSSSLTLEGTEVATIALSTGPLNLGAPAATVGPANVDGVATTALRSDATIAHGSGSLPSAHHPPNHDNSVHLGPSSVAVGHVYGAAPATFNVDSIEPQLAFRQDSSSIRAVTSDDSTNSVASTLFETYHALTARTNAVQESFPRILPSSTAPAGTALVSGQMSGWLMWCPKNRVINSITFVTGATASVGLTHSWAAVFNGTTMLGASADNTTAEWTATGTERTFTGGSLPVTIPADGLYIFALMVSVATTMPNLTAMTPAAAIGSSLAPNLFVHDTSDTGLTTPPSMPFTAASWPALAVSQYPWFYIK